jgi:hypothetical protein
MKKWVVLVLGLFLLVGCAGQKWMVTSTTTYVAGSAAMKVIEPAFHPPCNIGSLPADKCAQLKKVYNDTRGAYIAAGNALKLALLTVDSQQQANLMQQFPILWDRFSQLTNEIILLIQQIEAQTTMTTMPKLPADKREFVLTPTMIQLIVAGLAAVIQAFPAIYNVIVSGEANPIDTVALVAKIEAAQTALPVWG